MEWGTDSACSEADNHLLRSPLQLSRPEPGYSSCHCGQELDISAVPSPLSPPSSPFLLCRCPTRSAARSAIPITDAALLCSLKHSASSFALFCSLFLFGYLQLLAFLRSVHFVWHALCLPNISCACPIALQLVAPFWYCLSDAFVGPSLLPCPILWRLGVAL